MNYRHTPMFRDWLSAPRKERPDFIYPGWLWLHDAFNYIGRKTYGDEWTCSELRAISSFERSSMLATIDRAIEESQKSIETADTDIRNRPTSVHSDGPRMSHEQIVERAIDASKQRIAMLTMQRDTLPSADDAADLRRSAVWGLLRRFLSLGLPSLTFHSGTGKHYILEQRRWVADIANQLFYHGHLYDTSAGQMRWILVSQQSLDECLAETAKALHKQDGPRFADDKKVGGTATEDDSEDAPECRPAPPNSGHSPEKYSEYCQWDNLSAEYEKSGMSKIGAALEVRDRLKLKSIQAEYIAKMVREVRKRKNGII